MLKLLINPDQDSKRFLFHQETISIGEGSPDCVDICFPSEGLQENHLQIVLRNHSYWVINQANDPFVTHNGLPFGKKELKVKDVIQIRDHYLVIEEMRLDPDPYPAVALEVSPSNESSQSLKPAALESNEISQILPTIEHLAHEEHPEAWFPLDFNSPQENPSSPKEPLAPPARNTNQAAAAPNPSLPSEKQPPLPPAIEPEKSFRIMKYTSGAVTILVFALTVFFIEKFLQSRSQLKVDEALAASALADYAMAITYSSIHPIPLQKPNSTDLTMVKHHLQDLLSEASNSYSEIDSQGRLEGAPYLIRFYMSRDLSRFLLIAQPEATLSQWLIPRNSLILDSRLMEVHQIDDLRGLNRLLAMHNPLEGDNGKMILDLIQSKPAIPLQKIAHATGNKEFLPPIMLPYIKEGGENKIFNAPRYHFFSASLIKRTSTLLNNDPRSKDYLAAQNALAFLSQFQNMVVYVSGGVHEAEKASHLLKKAFPTQTFITAFIQKKKNKSYLNSYLVFDAKTDSSSALEPSELAEANRNLNAPLPSTPEETLSALLADSLSQQEKSLFRLLSDIHSLLDETLERDSLFLPTAFFQTLKAYSEEKTLFQNKISHTVDSFLQDHPDASEAGAYRLLRELGLLEFYQASHLSEPEPEQKKSLPEQWKAIITIRRIASLGLPPVKKQK